MEGPLLPHVKWQRSRAVKFMLVVMVRTLSNHATPASSSVSSGAWLTSATVVAICALSFTILTFWWLNARRGRLKAFEPHTFAAVITMQLFRLRIPIVLYNNGAIPIVIQNLRLRFPAEPGSPSLPWITTRSSINPGNNESYDFAAVFSVAGRTAHQMFVEFGAPSLGLVPEAREYLIQIEAKLSHKKKWKSILTFPLQLGHITDPGHYLAYRNTPSLVSKDQRRSAENALMQLAEQLTSKQKSSRRPEENLPKPTSGDLR